MEKKSLSRRGFMAASSVLPGLLSRHLSAQSPGDLSVEAFIRMKAERDQIPGLSAVFIRNNEIAWSHTLGFANLEKKIVMTLDHLQNIGSVSKTFTTTALMRQWEQGKFKLDDDVNKYLPFEIRNPGYPDKPITFRLLMTHHASIADGTNYSGTYACGDPSMDLSEWIPAYLTPKGKYYKPEENFHAWAPGEKFTYNNVAYGVLAYLTERISGVPFGKYCREHIFHPLGMTETSWYLKDIDTTLHSIPYTLFTDGKARGPNWGGSMPAVIGDPEGKYSPRNGFQGECLYNHPNFPDGFLRTSPRQISRYLRAYLNGGTFEGYQLLKKATVDEMLREQKLIGTRIQGLTWYAEKTSDHEPFWGHGGNDPGINTDVRMRLSDKTAALVFVNTNQVTPGEVPEYILRHSNSL